jgi:hypothetical protein
MEIKINGTWCHVKAIFALNPAEEIVEVGDFGEELEIEDIKFAGVTFLGDDQPEISFGSTPHQREAKDTTNYTKLRTDIAVEIYRHWIEKDLAGNARISVVDADDFVKALRETNQKDLQDLQN